MFDQLNTSFTGILGVPSHRLKPNLGASSFNDDDDEDDIDILESEYGITKEDFSRISAELDEEEDLEELDFED